MPDRHLSLLGFDFGLRQIGVASGQTLTGTASGVTILRANEGAPDWCEVEKLLQQWRPNLVVVGLPLNMDGSESELSQRARKFARRIHGRFGLNVTMVDERLTSKEAKMLSREQSDKQDRTKIDHIAAALIVESWLADPNQGLPP